METKLLHFQAAAQYRKSLEDLEANKYVQDKTTLPFESDRLDRYGFEVARLFEAHSLAKRGYDVARRGGAALSVQQDIKVSPSLAVMLK